MRTLITGGAGFIGSHLADLLVGRGEDVVVLDDLSTGRFANVEHLRDHPSFAFRLGSILDKADVDAAAEGCDRIFHLAAAVGVELIVEQPLESLRTNIIGSEIVVEAAHKHGTSLLVASTSEIYGKNTSDALGEDDDRILGSPLKSRWSYSEAKAIEEIFAYTYWREKGLRSVIARLFNTVGPRQTGSYGMVVPRFVQQALRGEPITIYGDGSQRRCFCHVSDVVEAMAALIDEPRAHGGVFNLGGTEEVTIVELAKRVIERTGSSSDLRYVPYDEAYEAGFEDMMRRVPDTTRARDLIGFRPQHDLDAIVDSVVASKRR